MAAGMETDSKVNALPISNAIHEMRFFEHEELISLRKSVPNWPKLPYNRQVAAGRANSCFEWRGQRPSQQSLCSQRRQFALRPSGRRADFGNGSGESRAGRIRIDGCGPWGTQGMVRRAGQAVEAFEDIPNCSCSARDGLPWTCGPGPARATEERSLRMWRSPGNAVDRRGLDFGTPSR